MMRIYTDGGCKGNPGPGGWAFIVVEDDRIVFEDSGADISTTNNKMELTAMINALKHAIASGIENLEIYTDSQYVKNGITDWINKWKKNSWRSSSGDPVKNQEYWRELDSLVRNLSINWNWVKGHSGNEFNQRCDDLVKIQREKDWT